MNNNLAINVCILPSKEVKRFCEQIYNQDSSDYSSENLEYIPHITLYQKSIQENDLKKIIQDIEKLNLNKFHVELWKFTSSTLFCVEIKRNELVTELQKEIIEILLKYPTLELTEESFLTEKYFFEGNKNWVSTYWEYVNFNKDLHITLWKEDQSEKLKNLNIPKSFTFDTLCIGMMGNYCSVRKVIKKINIT